MTKLEVREAGLKLADLIARVRAGEDVVIAEGGEPVARLVRADESPRRRGYGMFKDQVWMADDFSSPLTDEELKDWGL